MICEKCQDRGFIEENHGLIVILCDCEKGREYRAQREAILGIPEATNWEMKFEDEDASNSRTEPDNTDIGSTDTGEPEQPKKPKKKKRARKKSG